MSNPRRPASGRSLALRTLVVGAVVTALGLVGMHAASAALTKTPARTWGVNGQVLAIRAVGDRVYVGGTFSSVVDPSGISYPVKNLAVFSRSTGAADLSFLAGTNNTVTSLASDGTLLYVGGAFGTVSNGGTSYGRAGVAAVDLATGALSSWRPSVSGGQVDTITYSAATGSVYVGGNFTSASDINGTLAPSPYIAKFSASTGLVDTGFAARPDGRVRSINVAADGSGRLYVGGDFLSVSGAGSTKSLTAVDAVTGAVDTAFRPAPTNGTNSSPVYDITSDANRLYVGAAGSGGACTALTASTGAAVWSHHTNGNLQAVRLIGSTLYCGGHFSGTGSFDGYTRYKLAAVDAASGAVLSFAPNVNTALGIWALGSQPGDPTLYAGGDFTKISGIAQPHFAMFIDTTQQTAPQPPTGLLGQPGDTVVRLSWQVPSSDGGSVLKSYKLYRGTAPGGENLSSPIATIAAGTTAYADTAVVNDTAYYYVVKAVNALGSSVASDEVVATPSGSVSASPPSAPVSVSATNPAGEIDLTWNPPVSDGGAPVQSYNVYRATTSGGEGTTPYATGITKTSFADLFNLTAGTTYFYYVTAVNVAGESVPSTEVSATEQAGKPGPAVLSGSYSNGANHLTWTAAPDGGSAITKYVVIRDTIKLKNLPGTQLFYDDLAITSGTTYVYQVKAVNGVGNGQLSNKVTITVP